MFVLLKSHHPDDAIQRIFKLELEDKNLVQVKFWCENVTRGNGSVRDNGKICTPDSAKMEFVQARSGKGILMVRPKVEGNEVTKCKVKEL